MIAEYDEFEGDEEGLEGDDNIVPDFNRIEAEEEAIQKWAEEETLTAQKIDERLRITRERLRDIGNANLRYFLAKQKSDLLQLMTDNPDLDYEEVPDHEIEAIEERWQRNRRTKKSGTPVHSIIDQAENTILEETEEDEHPVYKTLKKRARRAVKRWCKDHPQILQSLEDDHIMLALAITEAKSDDKDYIVENRAAVLDYIRHQRTKIETEDISKAIDTPSLLNDVNVVIETQNLPEEVATILKFMCMCAVITPKRKGAVWPQQVRILLDSDESDRYNERDEGLPFMEAIADMLHDTPLKIHVDKRFRRRKKRNGQGHLVESYRLERRET